MRGWLVLTTECQCMGHSFKVNRGPNKRQIKPAENNSLLQLALGEDSEDSEEDEDFEVNDDDEEDEGLCLENFSDLGRVLHCWFYLYVLMVSPVIELQMM